MSGIYGQQARQQTLLGDPLLYLRCATALGSSGLLGGAAALQVVSGDILAFGLAAVRRD